MGALSPPGPYDLEVRAFDLVVVVSTVVGCAFAVWTAASPPPSPVPRASSFVARVLVHPLAQWALVWLLLLSNQVAFDAYVLRVHHGSPRFISSYIAETGWFALALDAAPVRWLAAHAGEDARWLAPSVLRVQAYLELPFTIYAYLAVARLLGRDVVRALTTWPVLFATSVSFSLTFSIVETMLPNPYTHDDLVLRALAAVTVPFWVRSTSRRDDAYSAARHATEGRPTSVTGILLFLLGAGCIALALLAAYDAFLLYNLGHLERLLPVLVVTWPVAIGASFLLSRRGEGNAPSAVLLRSMLAAFTVVFAVPSLAIRYRAMHETAQLCGAVVVVFGAALGFVVHARRHRALDLSLLTSMVAGLFAGGMVVALALRTDLAEARELGLAVVTALFLATFAAVARTTEHFV